MPPLIFVSGDDIAVQLPLTRNNESFVIAPGADMSAVLVFSDGTLSDSVTISESATGTNLDESTVVAEFGAAATADWEPDEQAELQVRVDGLTWYFPVKVKRGHV